MLRQFINFLLVITLLCDMAWAETAATPADIDRQLAQFAQQAGITLWPQLQGCGYEPFDETQTVGVLLKVTGPLPWDKSLTGAIGRWDGSCHVPIKHLLVNWPEGRPPGRYLLAVRQAPKQKDYERDHYRLQVTAIFDTQPVDEALEAGLMRRVCQHPAPVDRGCH